ncbi:M61 family metallopeptidase [Brackiella oedipodis]|uniref:M61 family metallopeptidase n=1 Tax=Brackiella oedipodis TaxID=124225 RepID=UPI000686F96A|nr:PDZ domain-containing protein [Brackiella oedipodis]
MSKQLISYRISSRDLSGHRFEISLHCKKSRHDSYVEVYLPTWIPGSYLIRDFARHIESMQAFDDAGAALAIEAINTSTWRIHTSQTSVTLNYVVYAWDLSVRESHLDQHHGFFNGSSVFLAVKGQEHLPCLLDIQAPKGAKHWHVYTSLPLAKTHKSCAKRHGFGFYQAPNYDALIDHPVEMGTPQVVTFKAGGITHEMVFTGLAPNLDLARIAKDCQQICQSQIELFEPQTATAPFADSSDRYVFMTHITENSYGGLEHRSSTALMIARSDLPSIGQAQNQTGYQNFLGLVSHEYFHSWNVKRIKPARFVPYDLTQATPTELLWVFEGFTSYYDDLMLWRSGVIETEDYCRLLQRFVNIVFKGTGQHKQTVAQSSFEAWTKYYKQNENSINAIVSYYTKGALTALCLDLWIRIQSQQRKSLDDVMRYLWQHFGRDFYRGDASQQGLSERGFEQIVAAACGLQAEAVADFLRRYVYGTETLPLKALLKQSKSHIRLRKKTPTKDSVSLNARIKQENNQTVLAAVFEHGAAHQAGLSANDILVAIDHLRVSGNNLETLLQRYQAGQRAVIHVFRGDELCAFEIKFAAPDTEYELYWKAKKR